MSHHLEGRLLEVCNCKVLCPCWIGEDPDNGTCDAIVAWQIDRGTVDGIEVGGLGWMLALAVVMAVEKNTPWGRHLSRPLGAALLGWSAWMGVSHA
jgi:hypothetical protein